MKLSHVDLVVCVKLFRPISQTDLERPSFGAGLAQLVEQLICNQQVAGSSPIVSSSLFFDNFEGRDTQVAKGGRL
jgi:hypothetical protein